MSWEEQVIYKVRTSSTAPLLEFNVQTTGRPREFRIFMHPINAGTFFTYKTQFIVPEDEACSFMNGVDNMVDYQVAQALYDLHIQSGWSF